MKRILPYCLILMGMFASSAIAWGQTEEEFKEDLIADTLIVSDPLTLFEAQPTPVINPRVLNLSLSPKVFSGYQKIHGLPELSKKALKYKLEVMTPVEIVEVSDTIDNQVVDIMEAVMGKPEFTDAVQELPEEMGESLPSIQKYNTPQWLRNSIASAMAQENLLYAYMIDNPMEIEYAYWDLPLPPVLLEEDRSFVAFLNKQVVPEVAPEAAVIPEIEVKKKHWLHKVNAQLQFSQAYVSPNWYQGGNSYLSMLFNFNWNVQLNQVYHPNILFTSDLTYKAAFSSNPKGYYHKYTIAEDNFQYNLNTGYKAFKNWYYSFNLQFKTQLFNNFEENSNKRTAAFLSPADLNMGLGMSYSHTNKLKTFTYTLTISPLSYNLKACLKPNDIIDHATYGIPADKHTKSEIGSNLEFNMNWKITPNIGYKTRVFMFTDYHYYMCDWQNTLNFEINKFLSTQIFLNLRYDGSTENYGNWKKFMLREILSFGLSYTFSTKP